MGRGKAAGIFKKARSLLSREPNCNVKRTSPCGCAWGWRRELQPNGKSFVKMCGESCAVPRSPSFVFSCH